jgi:endonuclease/exonuclease/phosphatase family metal-dependent hydrolase
MSENSICFSPSYNIVKQQGGVQMKVMTYNVHSCIDMQKKNSLNKVVELLKQEKPAVVGINEIESFSPRTRFANQPKLLALARDMLPAYGPTLKLGHIGFFGNAILSRYPIYEKINFPLPGSREPRCCLRTLLRIPEGCITVFCTHLGLNRIERDNQIAELARLVSREKNPVILMGDFNCSPDQLAPLAEYLTDTGRLFGARPTYPCDNPTDRIDYIFVSKEIKCKHLYIPNSNASDHLPVIADLNFSQQ